MHLLDIFYWFSSKSSVFVIFISFFAEVSKFHNRILTNHTPELVVRIRQWICCQSFSESLIFSTLIIQKQPLFLKTSQCLFVLESLLIKLAGLEPWSIFKRDSNTGAFLCRHVTYRGGGGRSPLPFFKIQGKVPWFWTKNALTRFIMG